MNQRPGGHNRMSNHTLLLGWRSRWNRSLLGFLSRRVHAAVDIEDLAQETYLRLLRARDLQAVRNPQAYLLRVASHIIAEWRDHQLPGTAVDLASEQLPVDDSDPAIELEAEVSQARLDVALANLSPMTRAVVLLKFREALHCKEIATALDLTERQVRRHLTRGFEKLRGALRT